LASEVSAKGRVLIVEDDELLGIALQDALTDAAYDAVGIGQW
jgi:hypothetical protein